MLATVDRAIEMVGALAAEGAGAGPSILASQTAQRGFLVSMGAETMLSQERVALLPRAIEKGDPLGGGTQAA